MLDSLPVTWVAGVGQAKAKALRDLGIVTVGDLLHHFPVRYEDRRILTLEAQASSDKVTVRAVVEGMATVRWQNRRSLLRARLLVDGRHRVTGLWFNQPYLKEKLTDGRMVIVSGKFDPARRTLVVSHTDFGSGDSGRYGRWAPVYRASQAISSAQLQTLIERAMEQYGDQVEELLPQALTQRYRLCTHAQALRWMHRPDGDEALKQARRRLVFEEFLCFQLQLQWTRCRREGNTDGMGRDVPEDAFRVFEDSLPHPLTAAQRRVCLQILDRLQRPSPMNLLVQGDVGSGKTWVALWAVYAMARAGGQSALMAPTEILAEQHFREAVARLEPLGLRVGLVTGSTPAKVRQERVAQLARGEMDLVVGTHALLTGDVQFRDLGLVITDEQHRFGVQQRAGLRQKGGRPDVLLLSATPIPRTLAMAIYGDIDVGVLDELPAGRKPIVTRWLPLAQEDRAIRLVRRELAAGRRAYVVAPLVEDSEQLGDVASATQLASRLSDAFAGYSVGLLHGRMSSRDKDEVMRAFVEGRLQVLISTTVIEVGIHVPEATVMMVYHAERFGLAQLHQLRGRVGRGRWQSYCILLSDAEGEMARRRLETLVETQDGFVIAERDLELRGPGELFGVRQSGLPEFLVGDLTRDFRVMEVARDEAVRAMESGDFWLLPSWRPLREHLQRQMQAAPVRD
ncbi:MAG: ATP-dependent DNA helicase RecG [Alicyclobacillus macrosporangiidus]|uniref:ATP-dependent DNA helicase RecG n=1 Tax=Alicyclobacillus macrosporangiidus TaxID=392015 RepID=UPI0026F018F9|nr:ATP-dependent DNA helicase RecG [Alicyclobacillus macrosporangiidus]MCL6598815.1 ATP-dependent DNA helicase RecG [Alicyclobacillus macrosporangiidus]